MTTITICGGLELIVGIIASKMTQWVIMFIAITWLESYKLTKFRILSSGRSPQQHVGKMSWFYHGWFVTTGLTRQKPISVCYLSVCVVSVGAYCVWVDYTIFPSKMLSQERWNKISYSKSFFLIPRLCCTW